MNVPLAPQSLAQAIIQASSYGETRGLARSSRAILTIALSRQAGAGGTAIANEVGTRLNWPVYDHALLERIANEMNLRTRLLESVDEKHRNWLLDCVDAFSQERTVTEGAYVRHLVQTILSLGAHGSCLIVGRGAAQVLPPLTTLRVAVVAPRHDRIANLALELSLSKEAAAGRLDDIDRHREAFIRNHFGKEPRDAANFDLILNSSRFSRAECAELIIEALHRREVHAAAQAPPK
jgi:cytidylate kinase